MARQRKDKASPTLKLAQPDRSGPSEDTLLSLAAKRGLLNTDGPSHNNDEEPLIGRLGDAVLWSTSLTMLHFTLDVLVTHQYAAELSWPTIVARAAQAFPITLLLVYSFHPHPAPSILLPRFPQRLQHFFSQLLFFVGSTLAGCYLIYSSNEEAYYAVMKRAPPLGCLWVWSVIELDLLWASTSLLCCVFFLKYGGYSVL